MKFIFLFLDGVGLGEDNHEINPLVRASLPNLDILLDGNKLIGDGHYPREDRKKWIIHTQHATLLALDACLGIDGIPQSASGQASLLTGRNIPKILGYHEGPKPTPEIIEIIGEGTLFSQVIQKGGNVSLLNAYPPRYFKSIETGYRLPGVIALAARTAGMELKTMELLFQGKAISTDFTAQGWHDHLGITDTPLLTPGQAGERISKLSTGYELSFFEYWLTDIAGHQRDMNAACDLLSTFDTVLGSLINQRDDDDRLILITSDHGNLEDLSTRRHTRNEVPLLLIGSLELRRQFIAELNKVSVGRERLDLTNLSPAILTLLRNAK